MSDQKSSTKKKTVRLRIESTPKEKHWDETFRLMSWWEPDKVQKAKVMVVGAGALGNEVLKNLALMNVGHIVIVDFDTIEYANLSRSVLFRPEDASGGKKKADVALKAYRDHLEELVEERTIKLTSANELLQQEIGERMKAEKEIARRNAELAAQNAIAATISQSLDLDKESIQQVHMA